MNLLTVTVARNPISESTVALNVLRWGTGGLNIEPSRIGTRAPLCVCPVTDRPLDFIYDTLTDPHETDTSKGRWPTNLILFHNPGCKYIGPRRVRASGSRKRILVKGTPQALIHKILGLTNRGVQRPS